MCSFMIDLRFLKAPLKDDGRETAPEIVEEMGWSLKAVVNYFKSFRFTQKLQA